MGNGDSIGKGKGNGNGNGIGEAKKEAKKGDQFVFSLGEIFSEKKFRPSYIFFSL